jgi:hypothetical protein
MTYNHKQRRTKPQTQHTKPIEEARGKGLLNLATQHATRRVDPAERGHIAAIEARGERPHMRMKTTTKHHDHSGKSICQGRRQPRRQRIRHQTYD